MEAKSTPTGLTAALQIAYRAIKALGIRPCDIQAAGYNISYNTIKRIRDGKPGKEVTDLYYLKVFITMLHQEYKKRIQEGGDGANRILMLLSQILLANFGIRP